MKFVDVILPLPLEGVFTYSVPTSLETRAGERMRVTVPLGRSKRYTGIILRVHEEKPAFECRDIMDIPDTQPVMLDEQARLWQWIADYYLSPPGEVMKAALPSGLKAEEGYKPKTETCLTLAQGMRNERTLQFTLDALKNARRQQKVLMDFLALSHWDSLEGSECKEEVTDITREELMNETRCSPAVIKALIDRKILASFERGIGRLNHGGEPHPERMKTLGVPQQKAHDEILRQFKEKNVVLLHGVTSSGKTEIYIHLIQRAIDEGRQVLYLLPEIALTVQMMERLRNVFGDRLGIYHSKYSDAERVEIWQKQLSENPYDVILGARSAVFLPFQRLGLVIVDEEHETSFKQQDPAPRYHARSAAIMLASMYPQAKCLLGTATPSMESYHNAQTGKYGLVELKTRYKDIELPHIEVVDIKDLQHRKMMRGAFSPALIDAVKEALAAGEQAILFQNRRGFAPMIECKVCGWVPKCQNCDVSLTYHRNTNTLVCHYCGYTYTLPTKCPNCESTELRDRGYGTEKVENAVETLFPEARTARMDLDTTRTRSAYERIISDFSAGKTNLLIGTQMVSKGLDFDRVSVVGILNADTMLNYPDFRAYEHAFMMMAQVSGRAGRKGRRGRVILQTKNPDLPVIRQVVSNDFATFCRDLLDERREFRYPPFHHLVYVYLKHRYDQVVESGAQVLGAQLRQWFGDRVLGPDRPAVSKVKTLNIRKIVLKLENGIDLAAVRQYLRQAQTVLLQDKRFATIHIYFDVDPL